MRFRTRAFLLIAVSACGTTDDETDHTTEQAVTETTCNVSTLAWNLAPTQPQVCAGPWQYQHYKDCSQWQAPLDCYDMGASTDPTSCAVRVAPPSTLTTPTSPSCTEASREARSHFQASSCYWASQYNTNAQHLHELMKTTKIKTCSKWDSDGNCYAWKTTTVLAESCDSHAQDKVNYYHTHFMGGGDGHANFGAWVVYQNPSTSGFYCDYDIFNTPSDYHYGPDSESFAICGGHRVTDPSLVHINGCYNPERAPAYKCGDTPGDYYTPFGQMLTGIGSDALGDPTTGTCLTLEQLPLPTGAAGENPNALVQAKFDALKTNYEHARDGQYTGIDNAQLRDQLERNLKLLFEGYGEYMTEAARTYVRALYAADNNLPACGLDVTLPTTTASCSVDHTDLDRKLRMCTRLGSHHVHGVKDMEDVANACIDVADLTAPLRDQFVAAAGVDDGVRPATLPVAGDSDCAYLGYRELWHRTVTDPLASRMEKLVDLKNKPVEDTPETLARMKLLDRWYTKVAQRFYPFTATTDTTDLHDALVKARWRETSKLEASFWRGIYRQLFSMADQYAASSGSGSGAATAPSASDIEAAAHDSLVADRAVLQLLYPASGTAAPLHGAPLLMLTSDALQAMNKRLQDISVYHDMGCTYLGCASGRNDSETSYLYRFFEAMANASDLTGAIAGARAANQPNNPPVVRPEWLSVFDQLSAQHRTFELALCDAANVAPGDCGSAHYAALENQLESAPSSLPAPATALGAIIQDATVRWSSYRTSGMLDPGARNKLPAGIQQAQVNAVIDDLRTTANQLSTKTSAYAQTMQQLAGAYLTDISQRNKVSDVEAQINAKQSTLERQTADIAGLREKIDRDNRLWGTFLDSYKTVTDVDGNALVQTESLGTFFVDASNARAAGPLAHNANVAPLNAAPNKYTVSKGDILHASVTGTWAPTCMIQANGNTIAIPGQDHVTVDTSLDPTIGPEGFTISLQNGTVTTHANTTSDSTTNSSGNSWDAGVCAGARAEVGYHWPLIVDISVKAYVDASACAKLFGSTTDNHQTGTTDSQSSSASATLGTSSGVRLPNTPFPNQPAGSVLLVYTAPNDPSHILRTEVVQREHASIAPADADVYVVANDIASSACTYDTSNQLRVTLTKLQNSATAAANVKNALVNVLDTLRAQGDAVVAQGSFSGAEQTSLRSAAVSAISSTSGCNCNFNAYPDPIKNFFYAWIDHEIATIDKKVQIYNLSRANNAVLLDIEALSQDLVYADKAGHIASMLPGWSLRNLDMELLRAEVRKLLKSATYDLYPILKLRFPTIFDGLATDQVLVPQIQTLVNAHWDDPVDNLAHAAYAATQALLDQTATIGVHQQDLAITTVGLQFTRPGLTTKYTLFPYADDARAKAVWDQITTPPHIVTFDVTPQDLYRIGGGSAIACTQEAPVIRDLGVVITGADADTTARFNPLYWYGPATAAPTMLFPTAQTYDQLLQRWQPGALESYTLADSGWQAQLVQFMFADSATSTFSKYDEKRPSTNSTFTTARGLSPFTKFTVDFSSFYAPDKLVNGIQPLFDAANPTRAKQVTLVMRVESRLNRPTLDYLPTCH
jgi:hypothetical protein